MSLCNHIFFDISGVSKKKKKKRPLSLLLLEENSRHQNEVSEKQSDPVLTERVWGEAALLQARVSRTVSGRGAVLPERVPSCDSVRPVRVG